MRKNSGRKWLHFTIDLLPFLIIPIFAIYEINHANNEPIEINTSGYEVTPKFETNEVNSVEDLQYNKLYHFDYLAYDVDTDGNFFQLNVVRAESITSLNDNISDITVDFFDINQDISINLTISDNYVAIDFSNNLDAYFSIETDGGECIDIDFYIPQNAADYLPSFQDYCQYQNILPTSSDFQSYDYVWNDGIVLNDTDIGSQFIYSLYKPVHNYFNFDNVFNLGELRQWFALNLFGGTMPLVIEIIWNVIIYEFLTDLIMLVYSFFMFLIDFINDVLDKPFSRAKGD